MFYYRARIARPGVGQFKKYGDERRLHDERLLRSLDYHGLSVWHTHTPPADGMDGVLGSIIATHWDDAPFVTVTLQLLDEPPCVYCSLGGTATFDRRPGTWRGNDFDVRVVAWDLTHLALIPAPSIPGCMIIEELPVDVAMGWPNMGPAAWNLGAPELEM